MVRAHYDQLFPVRRLWVFLAASMVVMFATLLYFGREIYQAAPPIPETVQSESGQMLFTRADIERGQGVWQAMGGMQQGSIWGHGGYLAPDWSADWLHREAVAYLDIIALREGKAPFSHSTSPGKNMRRLCSGWICVGTLMTPTVERSWSKMTEPKPLLKSA